MNGPCMGKDPRQLTTKRSILLTRSFLYLLELWYRIHGQKTKEIKDEKRKTLIYLVIRSQRYDEYESYAGIYVAIILVNINWYYLIWQN